MSAVTPKRMTVRELRQKVDSLTAERDRAIKRAVKHRRTIRDMEETRRLNFEELWHEAARQHYDDHDIDDICRAIEDLHWIVDCTEEVLSHLSEDARNEYHRVFDALLVGKRPNNGAP